MNLIIYAGNAGDRNERAMDGAVSLGHCIAADLRIDPAVVGSPSPVIAGGWYTQLRAASANLRLLSAAIADVLSSERYLVSVMGRCAASIVTLPLIARRYPDAAIVWFDAHGDSNTPVAACPSDMSYLGGMVITGAAGEWSTGFGGDVDLANVILVGARDLDPPERKRIDLGQIKLIPVGPKLGDRLREAVGGRRVYVHLDCDVLDAGLVATEYQCPGGLSFEDLREAFEVLAEYDPCGLEITEFEGCWPNGSVSRPEELLSAIQPLLKPAVA